MSVSRLIPTLIVALLAAWVCLWLYFATPATDEPYAIPQTPSDQPARTAVADPRSP